MVSVVVGSGRIPAVLLRQSAVWTNLLSGRRQHVHKHILLTAPTCKPQDQNQSREQWCDVTFTSGDMTETDFRKRLVSLSYT